MQEVLTEADAADTPRARVARFVTTPRFQYTIIGLILLNAVTLGLETSPILMATAWGGVLRLLDWLLLMVFTVELGIRIYAFRGRFFRDPWALFDLIVVGIAWMPATGPLAVLRALRVLRVLRLISVVPSMRVVVEAMLHALPGMGSIVLLMALVFYVFAVMATKLYGPVMPDRFGTLGSSLFTLFQMMTLESWAEATVRPILEHSPLAWVFFVPFILVATFVVLNLFIGVIVHSIQTLREQHGQGMALSEDVRTAHAVTRVEVHADTQMLLREIRALREEVAALRGARPGRSGAGAGAS